MDECKFVDNESEVSNLHYERHLNGRNVFIFSTILFVHNLTKLSPSSVSLFSRMLYLLCTIRNKFQFQIHASLTTPHKS
jgi:hypothetical protein